MSENEQNIREGAETESKEAADQKKAESLHFSPTVTSFIMNFICAREIACLHVRNLNNT